MGLRSEEKNQKPLILAFSQIFIIAPFLEHCGIYMYTTTLKIETTFELLSAT